MRLAVWSGPRNISTALMRSWENRPDTVVVDEPLYAHYLAVTGLDHPGRDEVVAAGETDWRVVVSELTGPLPDGVRVHYQKHMAHHLVDEIDDRSWVLGLTNVLLVRDPAEVVASYTRSRADGRARRTSACCSRCGCTTSSRPRASRPWWSTPPTSSTSRSRSCASCAGARVSGSPTGCCAGRPAPATSDGVWAPHWYAAVERSTGFERRDRGPVELHGTAAEVARACRPAYEHLHALRWTP